MVISDVTGRTARHQRTLYSADAFCTTGWTDGLRRERDRESQGAGWREWRCSAKKLVGGSCDGENDVLSYVWIFVVRAFDTDLFV